jgi:hypothetical protein
MAPKILLSSDSKEFNSKEECDCACADISSIVPNVQYGVGTRLLCPELHVQPIIEGYDLVFNPKTDTDIAVIDSSAMDILTSFHTPRSIQHTDPEDVVKKMIKAGGRTMGNGSTTWTAPS